MNRLLIKQTSNRRKYCSSCWKEVRLQQNREKALRYYHKQKLYQLENPANLHE